MEAKPCIFCRCFTCVNLSGMTSRPQYNPCQPWKPLSERVVLCMEMQPAVSGGCFCQWLTLEADVSGWWWCLTPVAGFSGLSQGEHFAPDAQRHSDVARQHIQDSRVVVRIQMGKTNPAATRTVIRLKWTKSSHENVAQFSVGDH